MPKIYKIMDLKREATALSREKRVLERGLTEKNPSRIRYIKLRLKRISILIQNIRPTKVGYNRIKNNEE